MFRSTRIARLLPLSLAVLLVTAIATTGQREKSASKSQDQTTTPRESVPLLIERGSDSKESSHVIVPSDPQVKLLRSFGLTMDQDPKTTKQRQDSAKVEDSVTNDVANSSFQDVDPLAFILCGRNGISAEEFAALQDFSEPPSTTIKPVAKSREEVVPVVRQTASKRAKVFRQ